MKRHLIIPDCQVKPGVPVDHLDWIGRYALEKRPDVLVHLGDFWDMESLSSYDRGKLKFEGRKYKADVEAGNKAFRSLNQPLDQFNYGRRRRGQEEYTPRKVYLRGNHECLDEGTRAVTRRGLVRHDNLRVGDEVLSVDDDGVAVWEEVSAVHRSHYSGDLLDVHGMLVTPNHRVVWQDRLGRWEEQKAGFLTRRQRFFVRAGSNSKSDWPVSDTDIRLAVWCMTDAGRSPYWTFYQRGSTAHRIENLLLDAGIGFSRKERDRDIREICGKTLRTRPEISVEFRIPAEQGRKHLDPLLDRGRDGLPTWFSHLSERQVRVALDEWEFTDGSPVSSGTSTQLYVSRAGLREGLQVLCAQNGIRTTAKEYRPGHWRLSVCYRPRVRKDSTDPVPVSYSGTVWCVTVPNGRFMVERNGKIWVTGNSRIERAVQENGHLEGIIGYHDLDTRDWEVHDFLVPVGIDGVWYSHYFVQPQTGRPYGGQAATRLKTIGHSFVQGHQQVLDYALRFVGGKSQHGLVAGSCALHPEEYRGPQAATYWNGVIVLNQVEDGSYDPSFVSLDFLCRKYTGQRLEDYLTDNYPDLWPNGWRWDT